MFWAPDTFRVFRAGSWTVDKPISLSLGRRVRSELFDPSRVLESSELKAES
ncbi:hypothetical protein Mapa_014036 [Marchantia paleacea]|nr:hypothetical protein Mapa_014036 [Marchantia paleacea]